MSDRLSATIPTRYSLREPGRGARRLLDAALLKLLASAVAATSRGHLHVTLPSGRTAVLGHGGGVEANIVLANYGLLRKVARRGLLGFAESYMAEDFETADLGNLFRFFLDNERAITAALPRIMHSAARDKSYHASRRNSRAGSRRNIAAHYDLGNEFYRLWLDHGMSYSSGIHATPASSLEDAQAAKHARIVELLDLTSDHDVLEIGCGWGGLAAEMLPLAKSLTAITISEQQLNATRQRLAAGPHAGRASVVFQDYRDTTGRFDRIASIEMIEAVGEDNWPAYFRTLSDRLKPGGVAVIQAITIRDDLYDGYRRSPDFIQRYIFPGGMLPTVPMMGENAKRAGLAFEEVERFGASYALTLVHWRRRFVEAWPRIEALGFDERFRRMWLYYLTYCEVGFEYGTIDVGLYRMRKTEA